MVVVEIDGCWGVIEQRYPEADSYTVNVFDSEPLLIVKQQGKSIAFHTNFIGARVI